jgi:MAX-like protein X
MESFSAAVSSVTYEDLWQSVLSWVDQHCSLMALRPGMSLFFQMYIFTCSLIFNISHVSVVMNSLRHLSKTTDILTDPSRLPDEATRAVCSADGSVTSSTSRSSATSTVT